MFFSMSLLFMWVIDFVMVGLLKQDGYTFTLIAAFTPVLSAMFLMTVIHPGRVKSSPRSRMITFFVVLVAAGAVRWISRIWWEHDLSWRVLPGDAVLVLLTAFIASSAFSGRRGIRSLLQPITNWRVSWIWYAFAVLFWPALTLAGNLLAVLLNIPVPEAPKLPDAPIFLVIPVSFAWAFFFNGTIGEEGGWRGFALPRLQSRFSPLVASIILGFFWGAFHWSGFFIGYRGNPGSFWIRLGDIALAIIFTWLYNRLKGKSLLPLLLLHASMNATSTDFLPRARLTVYSLLSIVVLAMIFKDRMWKRQPEINADPMSGCQARQIDSYCQR
jgi:membrane protease YdiL (CAAX protease family)